MDRSEYAFPLAIQTVLPESYRERGFRKDLELLQELGFSGVELNIARPEAIEPGDLQGLLGEYGLQMTMFASGATAKAEGLSLSAPDDGVRLASVRRCVEFLDFAAEFGAGLIVGFLKGGMSDDRERARELFQDSVSRLEARVRAKKVALVVEATNRYESSVGNSLEDVASIIEGFQNPYLRILPDTFHMNIEECNMPGALVRYRTLYDSVHLSDNNRYFPGLGAIDFSAILRFLKEMGYRGSVAIEGNVRKGFAEDLQASMQLLRPMLVQLGREGGQ